MVLKSFLQLYLRFNPKPLEVIYERSLINNCISIVESYMFKVPVNKYSKWTIQSYPISKYKHDIIQASLSYFDIPTPFKVIKTSDFQIMKSDPATATLKSEKI